MIFMRSTLLQYIVVWRVILRQLLEIEGIKKRFANANCYDVERSFFDID